MFEPNIKCDYEGCEQRYLRDKQGWWVVTDHKDNANSVLVYPLTEIEYFEIVNDGFPGGDERHCCGIEHTSIFIKRKMDEINQILIPSKDGRCMIDNVEFTIGGPDSHE